VATTPGAPGNRSQAHAGTKPRRAVTEPPATLPPPANPSRLPASPRHYLQIARPAL
jgi:hypothetical protein